jgi:hypothetical protein
LLLFKNVVDRNEIENRMDIGQHHFISICDGSNVNHSLVSFSTSLSLSLFLSLPLSLFLFLSLPHSLTLSLSLSPSLSLSLSLSYSLLLPCYAEWSEI